MNTYHSQHKIHYFGILFFSDTFQTVQNQIIISGISINQWSNGLNILLLVIQLSLFLLERFLDDLSWYDLGIPNEVNVFQGIGDAAMSISVIIKVIRKWEISNIIKILFWRSQLKFIIPWALVILIVLLFFNIFGCQHHLPETELVYFYISYDGCCINLTQIILTNLNYSLICNTKAHLVELIVYEIVLFVEIIYNGTLLLLFVNNLDAKPKDYSILYISIAIANKILIMDLIFRAAFEEREKQQEKELFQQRIRQQILKMTSIVTVQAFEKSGGPSNLQTFTPMKK